MAQGYPECYMHCSETLPQLPSGKDVSNNAGRIKPPGTDSRKGKAMGRIVKALVLLVIVGFIGLTAYAYLGDLSPEQTPVTKPVVLNAD